MAAENYHLKWDSHLSYLNSSVATLYKNEKFADVVLHSSRDLSTPENAGPSSGIWAHKFILSSCSQFFSAIFENSPIYSPNGMLYVVLPPELSYRTIQILVQYMYSGEATVSNDILSEVLRGGELLKIRGLCRTTPVGQNSSAALPSFSNRTHAPQLSTPTAPVAKEMNSPPKCPSGSNSRVVDTQFRGLGASVLPKGSPITQKSTQKNHQLTGSISINKDVAIDPENKRCCDATTTQLLEPLLNTIPTALCNAVDCASCPLTEQNASAHHRHSDELANQPKDVTRIANDRRINRDEKSPQKHHLPQLNRDLKEEKVQGTLCFQEPFTPLLNDTAECGNQVPRLEDSPEPFNVSAIKKEPLDWIAGAASSDSKDCVTPNSPIPPPKQTHTMPLTFRTPLPIAPVKIEAAFGTDDDGGDDDDDDDDGNQADNGNEFDIFSRIVCEVCKKTFGDPKSWIHHMDTHNSGITEKYNPTTTDYVAKSCVPKKRRRMSSQQEDHVMLQCDLCSIPFSTPAEWVRHIHSKHTEMELAVFNSKKDSEQQTSAQQTPTEGNSTKPRRKRESTVIRNQQKSAAQQWTE